MRKEKWYEITFYTNKPEEAINKLCNKFTGKIDNLKLTGKVLSKKEVIELYEKPTQPLSACCKARCNEEFFGDTLLRRTCTACFNRCDIATPDRVEIPERKGAIKIGADRLMKKLATPEQPAKKEKEGFTTCCNYVVDTNGREFRCRRCHKPCDMYGVVIEATPDTEDDLEKYIKNLIDDNTDWDMQDCDYKKITKGVAQLIRTEKLKVLEQVKLEKEVHERGELSITYDWRNGYNAAVSELNAIRKKLRKKI